MDEITGKKSKEKTDEMLKHQISVLKLAHEQMTQIENVTKTVESIQWDLAYVLLTLPYKVVNKS